MVDTLYDAHYGSREKLAWAFAEILNEEARGIAEAGIDVIQFDEPAFNVYFDEVRDWGIATLERAAKGLDCTTAVHICYGYGIKANVDWKKTLGSEWRQYEQTFPLLARSTIGQVSLECANSHVPIELLGLLQGKDVLVGAVDVATDRVETPEDVAATIREAMRYVPAARLYPCTNCGMVPLARDVARAKLEALGAGAALVRAELPGPLSGGAVRRRPAPGLPSFPECRWRLRPFPCILPAVFLFQGSTSAHAIALQLQYSP